jgi:hypothetical protein
MLMTVLVGTARNLAARRDSETGSADLKMSVRVYNYAGSSADMLKSAESDAARIFAKAGVHLEWHECPVPARAETANSACAAPLAPSDLQLRIVKRVSLMPNHAGAEIGGFTVGNLATVQMEPLLEAGRPTACLPYQMLGRAIAHEFGHALLGAGHSSRGIMQARWGEQALGFAAVNEIVFTPDQEKALQLAVEARNRP